MVILLNQPAAVVAARAMKMSRTTVLMEALMTDLEEVAITVTRKVEEIQAKKVIIIAVSAECVVVEVLLDSMLQEVEQLEQKQQQIALLLVL